MSESPPYLTAHPITADKVETFLCTVEGVEHDFRPREWKTAWNTVETAWVCVWCDGIACGNYGEADPCWRVYHHGTPHRTRSGVEWPIGGDRPQNDPQR